MFSEPQILGLKYNFEEIFPKTLPDQKGTEFKF